MAPKPKRWRYKPGQRERRERRLEREVAEARLAGDRSGPPLTLFHPRLSTSLPDHVFQEEEVAAESVPVSSSEEYEEVLLEEAASSSAAPAPDSRLRPKPKKRPRTSPSHGAGSRGEADSAESAVVKEAVRAASKPNIWFDESSPPPVSKVLQIGTLRVAPISAARREACRSGWPGWRYAAPARMPGIRGGRARAWRVGQMARMLKRPWSKHWRRIYQECHKVWRTWQDGVPQLGS
eukprot:s5051_g2.t1